MYRGSFYCPDCARDIKREVRAEWKEKHGTPFEDNGDSEGYPQGPLEEGGGESDSPNHCDGCGVFLENPLTRHGVEWMKEQARGATEDLKEGNWPSPAFLEWKRFYDDVIDFDEDEDEDEDER